MNRIEIGKKKGISIVHLNARSLYKNLPEISILYPDNDFLLFSETWFDSRYTDGMITIPNYVSYRLDRCEADPRLIREGKIPNRGGGVIIYARKKCAPFLRILLLISKICY